MSELDARPLWWLAGSDFDIVHFAGRAGFNAKNKPVIEVMGEDGSTSYVTGKKLGVSAAAVHTG